MDRQPVLFLTLLMAAVLLALFIAELMGSNHGEIAQALGNLVGAGLGGGIAVFAANYQVKKEFDLKNNAEAQANEQRVRNARVLLCAEFTTIGRYSIKQLAEISDKNIFGRRSWISSVPTQLSLESIGIGLSELSFEEVTLVVEARNRLNELLEVAALYNNGLPGWGMDEKANELLLALCKICAHFLEVCAPRAGLDASRNIDLFKKMFD